MSLSSPVRHFQVLLVSALVSICTFSALATEPGAKHESQPAQDSASISAEKARLAENYGNLPLSFQANAGQTESQVKFLSKGSGYGIYLTGDQTVLALEKAVSGCSGMTASKADQASILRSLPVCAKQTSVVSMRLAGDANPFAIPIGEQLLPGTANYFTGSDPGAWHTSVPTFAQVRYRDVYPGVDLVYYGNQRQLEYDFKVAPHADPNAIRLQFSGVNALRIDAAGNLVVEAREGNVEFRKPVVYQELNGHREWIAGRFTLGKRHTVGFKLGDYDHAHPLVIDPVLAYSTYLGGNGSDGDEALAITVDASGDAYVTGQTDSTNFPLTSGAAQSTYKATGSSAFSGFVTKLNATGTSIVYSTFLGGSGNTQATAIAVDSSGDAYITGHTFSTNFPVTSGAYQAVSTANVSGYTGFVSKLNAAGTALLYSTYLGGSGNGGGSGDTGYAIAVDSTGNAYVAGYAESADFPSTSGAFQITNPAYANYGSDAFVTKMNPTGTGLVWSTLLGGSGLNNGGDVAYGLVVNSSGNAYVTGSAGSTDFPVTPNAFQTSNPGASYGVNAGFVAELNATGTGLVYSTYLGGSEGASGAALAVDATGDAYIAGYAMYSDFPVTGGAFQTTNPAAVLNASCAFVSKLNPTGTALLYSTLLGGSGAQVNAYNTNGDSADGIAIDASGDAYVTGVAWSSNFPVTSGAIQKVNSGAANVSFDAFVTEINPAGTGLVYSTYLGGSGTSFGSESYYRGDQGTGVALDSSGNVYVGGVAYSGDFPTTAGVFQPSNLAVYNSGSNAFVSKISMGSLAQAPATAVSTTTTLGVTANPSMVGNSVTFTAVVAAGSGSATPTGSLSFAVDGSEAATVALNSGTATYSSSTLTAGSHTVSASYAGATGFANSVSSTLTETVNAPAAAAPAFSPAVGSYTAAQTVTLSSATAGATIYYTTDGTTPSSSSTKYTGAIPVGSTTTIASIAAASGYANSVVATGQYLISATVATPTFSVVTGTYATTQTVTISDTTPGATIYYTNNGTTPTTSSTKYNTPLNIPHTECVQAIAVLSGDNNSAVAIGKYTIIATVATPTFSVAPGSYAAVQSVTLADATSGATIYYTTDGTLPTTSSAKYSSVITVSANETLEAIAVLTGDNNSAVASAVYAITPAVPVMSVATGTYATTQTVTISDTTPGATIYYTNNGTTPTTSSSKYTTPLNILHTQCVQAIAVLSGTTNSAVAIGRYTIVPTVATPTFSIAAGTYAAAQSVTLADATSGATIYYTTNGATPTTSSTTYSSAITVSANETLEAIAVLTGENNSAVASAVYAITPAVPVVSVPTGTYTTVQSLQLTCATPGATIYFTTNGTAPTTSSTKYTTSLNILHTEDVQAIAVMNGETNSAVVSAKYWINLPTAVSPAVSIAAGVYSAGQTVSLSTPTTGATIYYTTNGTTPTTSSSVYAGPINVTASETITAIAGGTNFVASAPVTAAYTIN